MNNTITIGNKIVGQGHPAFIIAEIGNNHDGSLGQAKALIDAAQEAGVDAVKFQTHIASEEMIPNVPAPPHFPEPRFSFMKRMELNLDQHKILKEYAESKKLIFLSSVFSVKAVDLLQQIQIPAIKVPSGEVTNIPLLNSLSKLKIPMLLSTGMSNEETVDKAVKILQGNLAIFHCVSLYPCNYEYMDLNNIPKMIKKYSCPIGLSDHTPTIFTSIASIPLGCSMIEKHFTLSKRLYGPDHKASLDPSEMRLLVDGVRAVEAALRPFNKEELPNLAAIRATFEKSIVAKNLINSGDTISEEALAIKRPGTGIPSEKLPFVIGKRAKKTFMPDELITEDGIE